jgi:hypothetical protein
VARRPTTALRDVSQDMDPVLRKTVIQLRPMANAALIGTIKLVREDYSDLAAALVGTVAVHPNIVHRATVIRTSAPAGCRAPV